MKDMKCVFSESVYLKKKDGRRRHIIRAWAGQFQSSGDIREEHGCAWCRAVEDIKLSLLTAYKS